jgi:hypothetical protein
MSQTCVRLAQAASAVDQCAVAAGAAAVGQVERVFQARAQHAAEFGDALVQRPDLRAADQRGLPGRAGSIQRSSSCSRSASTGMPEATPMTKLYSAWSASWVTSPAFAVHRDRTHDADVEAFELGPGAGFAHHVEEGLDLFHRIVEDHRRPGPFAVLASFR